MTTSKHDINFFSVSANVCELYSGTDHPTPSSIPNPPHFLPAEQWDATLKICDGTTDIHLSGVKVSQGKENSVDMNNGVHDVSLEGEFGIDGLYGDQVITVKGGCHDIKFSGSVVSTGRNATIVVGAWSDQAFEKSYNLDFSGLTGVKSVILARSHGVNLPPGAKVLRWTSFGYSLYWWGKWALVRTGLWNLFK